MFAIFEHFKSVHTFVSKTKAFEIMMLKEGVFESRKLSAFGPYGVINAADFGMYQLGIYRDMYTYQLLVYLDMYISVHTNFLYTWMSISLYIPS